MAKQRRSNKKQNRRNKDINVTKEYVPKKTFSTKDLCSLSPKSDNQEVFIEEYLKTDTEVFGLFGYAGTGKTFLAIRLGLEDVLDEEYEQDKLIIFRSAVDTRDTGFKPGSEEDKDNVYAKLYPSLMNDVFGNKYQKVYQNLLEIGKVKFETTSNQRGITYNNAVFVIDEAQNLTFHELETIFTRGGKNCRIIFCGDVGQDDLIKKRNDKSGLAQWIEVLNEMEDTCIVEFYSLDDIVRSGRIKNMILAKIKLGMV